MNNMGTLSFSEKEQIFCINNELEDSLEGNGSFETIMHGEPNELRMLQSMYRRTYGYETVPFGFVKQKIFEFTK